MLELRMVIPCTIYRQITDEYGDMRKTAGVSTTCWFRDIETVDTSRPAEAENTNSMAWLRGTESLSEGDLLTIGGNDYRVLSATYAKRRGSSDVEFIKCNLKKQGATVS